MTQFAAFACGLVFALGLGIGGMTQPRKVLAFLDVAGAWDPSLLFVMGGALLVTGLTFPRILARRGAVLGGPFALAGAAAVDARLLGGAALFGIGWGLSGYCPGPALVSLVSAAPRVVVFVAAMVVGWGLVDWTSRNTRGEELMEDT